jgi:myosin protein heavy chain
LEKQLRLAERKLADYEDAVLATERQKADWARKLDKVSRDLTSEKDKVSQLQTRSHQSETEVQKLQERLANLNAESQIKDEEIALLRSRENKTIVEHVHVLEKAKKVTDRELAATKRERDELAVLVRSLDQHKARLISDIEDMAKQNDLLRKQAKSPPTSSASEDTSAQLVAERKAKAEAERRIQELEKRLQSGVEAKELRKQLELAEKRNASLEKDLTLAIEQARTVPRTRETSLDERVSTSPSHTRLLQELQLNNEQLKHQMSEELRRGQVEASPADENMALADASKRHMGKRLLARHKTRR